MSYSVIVNSAQRGRFDAEVTRMEQFEGKQEKGHLSNKKLLGILILVIVAIGASFALGGPVAALIAAALLIPAFLSPNA